MPEAAQFQRGATDLDRAAATGWSRRRLLGSLSAASSVSLLSACGGGLFDGDKPPPIGTRGQAVLLAPLSGPSSEIGQMMRQVASLGGNVVGPTGEIDVRDAGPDEASATAAAKAAVDAGAKMLVGPLFSGQCQAVAAAVGRVPVIGLSNDSAIAGGNLWIFGITPFQSAKTVFGFAASRNLRRIGIAVPPGAFGARSVAAAQEAAKGFGLPLARPVVTESAAGLVAALTEAGGGTLPEAVYLPSAGATLAPFAAALAGKTQILGSDQWSAVEPERIAALRDSWFAAPDPIRFQPFALAVEDRMKGEAGVLAGLTFDAVEAARLLGRIGQQDRKGLLRKQGFDGVTGPFHFEASGQVQRGLAVLKVSEGATTLIGSTTA